MPQHAVLSNGARLDIPDGASPEEIRTRVNTANALVQSHAINLIKGGKGIWDALNAVAGSAGRIAGAGVDLNPIVGGVDLGISGLNALKAVASKYAPSLKGYPDLPTAASLATEAIGAPPLSPDASPVQRYVEAATTGALTENPVRTGVEMVGATGGGDVGGSVGNYFGGPEWEKFGRWIGSLGGADATRKLNPVNLLAGSQAPAVSESAAKIGAQPTMGALANTTGRGVERALGAFPIVNIPIVRAQQRMEEGVRTANVDVATKLNQGTAPKSDVYSIGNNLIQAARTKSAAIKADASQQFENLYSQLPSGNSTLVDGTPILSAIEAQANSPSVSAQQKADLMDRYNYFKSMTYGQPGYNGPRFQGVTPVNAIPIGQLARFRSELGEDLNTMRGLDATAQGPARDAATTAMQGAFARVGLGDQFNTVNTNCSRNIGPGTPTDILDKIGGKPIRGKPGLYEGGMDENSAFSYLNTNLQSPSSLEPLVDPSNPHWREASAGFVSSLGSRSGQFNAVDYGRQVGDGSTGAGARAGIADPVLEQLTRGQPDLAETIRHAANIGANASSVGHAGPSSTTGLLGAEWLMDQLGGHIPSVAAPFVLAGAGAGMESRPFTSAMTSTGGSAPLVDALYTVAPAAYNLNDPNDPRNQPPPGARPPSPLDQLNPPPTPAPQ